MHLANKAALWLLLMLPVLIFWNRFLQRRGHRYIWFSSHSLFPVTGDQRKFFLIRNLFYFKIGALALFLLALARPQLVNQFQVEENRGIDILLTLDTSYSMASLDFKPKNRLEVAKDVIAGFIEKRQTDRIGLVVYAPAAYTRCPLTVDYEILKMMLQEAEIGELGDGTAIGNALATSVNRLRHSKAKTKVIILLTDGNNNKGEIDPRDAAAMARDSGIKVYTIGVGTQGEAPYPYVDSMGRQHYEIIPVEIDEELLKDIAKTTGGLYFRATDTNSLQLIFSEIDRWEKTKISFRTYVERKETYQYFMGLALLILILTEVSRRTFLRTLP